MQKVFIIILSIAAFCGIAVGQFRLGTQIYASGLRFDAAAAFGLTRFSPRTGVIFGVTYLSPSLFTPAK